ncbi:MAG: SNF2 helicase associated domain-containing protein [Bacilli bacterium]|nr:SNF2 helicase associated domain-containing protein [Bacilli bacterium]
MIITEDYIQRIASKSQNYRWAKKHYQDYGMYDFLEIKKNREGYKIEATINYSYNHKYHQVININYTYDDISYKCDCPFNDNYSGCGHIAAILLLANDLDNERKVPFIGDINYFKKLEKIELQKQLAKQELAASLDILKDIDNNYEDLVNQIINEGKYNIYFNIVEEDDYFEGYINLTNIEDYYFNIQLSVGTDKKKYKVKDLYRFSEAIMNKSNVKYGKFLEFVHSINVFNEEVRPTLEKLLFMINDRYSVSKDSRFIKVTYRNLDEVYQLLKDCPKEFVNYNVEDIDNYLRFNVKKKDGTYTVKLVNDDYIYAYDGFYEFDDVTSNLNKVYSIKEEFTNLFHYLYKNKHLVFDEESFSKFYNLFANDDNLIIEGLTTDFIINQEDSLTLYGDLVGSNLVVNLEASKDEDKINVLENNNYDSLSNNAKKAYFIIKNSCDELNNVKGEAYFNVNGLNIDTFLEKGISSIQDYCDVMVSESLKNFGYRKKLGVSVGVRIKNDLVELNIDSISIDKKELMDIFDQYKRKKKYYRLKNGEILNIDNKEIKEAVNIIDDFNLDKKALTKDNIKLPLYRSFYAKKELANLENVNAQIEQSFSDFINNFENIDLNKLIINKQFNDILHPYQQHGVKWLMLLEKYHFGGILADDMGLGKTLQVIALLESIKSDKPSIVICPASLMLNWDNELTKFNSSLTRICIHGSANERESLIAKSKDYDLLITTYDYMKKDIDYYHDFEFNYVIIDEAQYIKNPKTKAAVSVKQLNSKNRLALSGTPIENNLSELWSIFDFLMPGYLYNYHYFKVNIETPIIKDEDSKKQELLKTMVEPFILRRKKKDVLTQLPDKIEKVLKLDFNDDEKKIYQAKLIEANKEVQEILKVDVPNKIMILKILNELRQICCDSRLLFNNINHISSKLSGCLEIVDSLIASDKKMLIFSSYTSVLTLIENELIKKHISYFKIIGSVNKLKRKEIVDSFQEDDTPILLISLKAGGTGLNLTAAQAVIHFDPWWNLSAENQATDRTHRIGQENDVYVYKLIMHDSIEEKILELQNKKKDLSDIFVEDSKGSIASLSKDEIIDLFKI